MANEDEGVAEIRNIDQVRIRRVPNNLMEFLRSRIVHYVESLANLSAEILEIPGQPAKLVLYGAESEASLPRGESVVTDTTTKTNKILIKNVPASADEELLEAFFEHRKKGGALVESVHLNRQKNWAIIEFSENDAVERLMCKTPIKLMDTELDICPHIPLLQGDGLIENLEIRTLPKELTEQLLAMHVEGTSSLADISSAEYKSDEDDTERTELTMQQIPGSHTEKEEVTAKQTIRSLKPVQLMMLLSMNYVDTVSEQFPRIKVDIDLEKKEISYDGNGDEIHSFLVNLIETLNVLATYSWDNISEDTIELYMRDSVVEYINNKFKSQDLLCAWAVQGTVIELCSAEADINGSTNIVREIVTEVQFPISKESSATFLTPQWREELTKIRQEHEILFDVFPCNDVMKVKVISTDNVVETVVNRIKGFLKGQLKISSEGLPRYYSKSNFETFYKIHSASAHIAKNVVDKIAEDLSIHHVSFTISNDYYRVRGTCEGITLAKERLERLWYY